MNSRKGITGGCKNTHTMKKRQKTELTPKGTEQPKQPEAVFKTSIIDMPTESKVVFYGNDTSISGYFFFKIIFWRCSTVEVQAQALESVAWIYIPSVTYWVCNLGQVPYLLCAQFEFVVWKMGIIKLHLLHGVFMKIK